MTTNLRAINRDGEEPEMAREPLGAVHLLLDEAEVEALIDFGAAMEAFLREDTPLNTATIKCDEQLAAQRQSRKWKADDMCDLLWDAAQDLRNRHPDDPALREWAEKAVDLIVGRA